MKKTSGQLIQEAVEFERKKIAAEEKKRITDLLAALARAYWLEQKVKEQQAVIEAIKTIERYV